MVAQADREDVLEEEEDILESDPAFAAVDQEFRKTLAQMQRRQGMATYSVEFKRAVDLLGETHGRVLRLQSTCRELTARLSADTERAREQAAQSARDQQAMLQQKQELEAAWRQLDASHAREHDLQELADDLRRQVNKLTSDLEQKSRLGLDQGDDYGLMAKNREGLAKEREKLLQELVTLKDRLARAASTRADLEQQLSAAEARAQDLAQELEVQANELAKETRLKEKLQEEARSIMRDLDQRTADAAHLSFQLAQAAKNAGRGEAALREQRLANERLAKENESLTSKVGRLQTELETQALSLDKAVHDAHRKHSELRAREDELSKLRAELARAVKARDAAEKRSRQEEARRAEHEADKERLRGALAGLERAADQADRERREQTRLLDRAERERGGLRRRVIEFKGTLAERQEALKEAEQKVAQLRLEVRRCEEELARRHTENKELHADRDKAVTQKSELETQLEDARRSAEHLQARLAGCEQRERSADQQLNKLGQAADALRLDNNGLVKTLARAKDDAAELAEKLEMSSRQVAQLKDEVASRELMLFRSRSELQRSERDREALRLEVDGLRQQTDSLRAQFMASERGADHSARVAAQRQQQAHTAERARERVQDERDLLGAQLARRNQEVALLREKARLMGAALSRGRRTLGRRLEDTRLLKTEIKRLRQEKSNLSAMIRNSAELRLELYQTTRQLTHAQVKCRALEEEMQTPLNVHRWRRLEGTDPPQMELVLKVQLLQRRLLSQASQLLSKEAQLRDAEQRCLQAQQELARTPGPQLARRLQSAQRAVAERERKLKCLSTEVRLHETNAEAQQLDHQKLQEEITELKKKYFQLKKREQQLRALHSSCPVRSLTLSHLLGRTRVLGGGYSLDLQPPKEPAPFYADSGSEVS